MDGLISEYLRPSDHLVCDIDSLDIWMKINLLIESNQKNIEADLNLKFDKSMTATDIHNILQKLCMQIWN
jgi:hypothetical protein